MTNASPASLDLEALAQQLEASPDFKVLRRLVHKDSYGNGAGRTVLKGVVADTETTGLRQQHDKIIELGLVAFEFDPHSGEVFRILESFNALEDPHMTIPAETTAIHGITNAMVDGQHIDDTRVNGLVADAAIIIAHNSSFDRPFMERRFPIFKTLPWGCSFAQINWKGLGLGSQKLGYIANQCGFFFNGHRAEEDCRALLEILQTTLPQTGLRPLKYLIDSFNQKNCKVWARGSRFDTKDALKERSYRWDGDEKCWHKTVTESVLDAELVWLKSIVYGNQPARIDIDALDAYSRFSERPGSRTQTMI